MNILEGTVLTAKALGSIKTRLDELITAQVGNHTYAEGKVYKLTCRVEPGVMYCGSTCATLNTRLQGHRNSAGHEAQSPLYRYMADVGIENIDISLIEHYPCRSRRELEAREYHWIRELRPALNVNGVLQVLADRTIPARYQGQSRCTKTLEACGILAEYSQVPEINSEQFNTIMSQPSIDMTPQQLNESFRYAFDNEYCLTGSNVELRAQVYRAIVTSLKYEATFHHIYAESCRSWGPPVVQQPMLDRKRVVPTVLESINMLCQKLEIDNTYKAGQLVTHTSLSNIDELMPLVMSLEAHFGRQGRAYVASSDKKHSVGEIAGMKGRLQAILKLWSGASLEKHSVFNNYVNGKRAHKTNYVLREPDETSQKMLQIVDRQIIA